MTSVADLFPLASTALAPLPAAASSEAPAASWFDEGATPALRIGADLGPASRGLTVAQHADRVLGHLCDGRPDEP